MFYDTHNMCVFCTYRTPRQERSAILFFTEAAVQSVNLLFYLVPNAYLLTDPCLQQTPLIFWSGWVRWTCWNTVGLTIATQCFLTASHVADAVVMLCFVIIVLMLHERLLWLFVCCFLCCNAVLRCCLCQCSRSDKQHDFCLLMPFLLFPAVVPCRSVHAVKLRPKTCLVYQSEQHLLLFPHPIPAHLLLPS